MRISFVDAGAEFFIALFCWREAAVAALLSAAIAADNVEALVLVVISLALDGEAGNEGDSGV